MIPWCPQLPATSAPGLGSPRCHIGTGTESLQRRYRVSYSSADAEGTWGFHQGCDFVELPCIARAGRLAEAKPLPLNPGNPAAQLGRAMLPRPRARSRAPIGARRSGSASSTPAYAPTGLARATLAPGPGGRCAASVRVAQRTSARRTGATAAHSIGSPRGSAS